MKINVIRFLIRWGLPSFLGAFACSGGFAWNVLADVLNGKVIWYEAIFGFLISAFIGAAIGATWLIYRPPLRKLGRHLGDFLTGALTMNLVLLIMYFIVPYTDSSEFKPKDPASFVAFMTAIGAFGGWIVNITKAENEVREMIADEIMNSDESD
ncbi:MAG: hypothetical protein ACPGU4_12990 [Flavobacteriales bacterium]